MWYVIQTHSGSEHDVRTWINTYIPYSMVSSMVSNQ